MNIEIIDRPIRFLLYGYSADVEDHCYGKVGRQLMDKMWDVVRKTKLSNGGINHWVYLSGDCMLVGVEIPEAEHAAAGESLECCEFELSRYSRHVHIGSYDELPKKWQALNRELASRGERISMPSLEIYGDTCNAADESQAETTILLGLESV